MAETTTYTCDRCKSTSVDNEILLSTIRIQLQRRGTGVGYLESVTPEHTAQWCRACLEKAGITHPFNPATAELPEKKPTLEDIIRDIVRLALGEPWRIFLAADGVAFLMPAKTFEIVD